MLTEWDPKLPAGITLCRERLSPSPAPDRSRVVQGFPEPVDLGNNLVFKVKGAKVHFSRGGEKNLLVVLE